MDTDLQILGVNQAFAAATHHEPEQVLDRYLFEAFPDNPDDPSSRGMATVAGALERALSTGEREPMSFQRYDVPDPARPGTFLPKVWLPVHMPVTEDGRVVGVLHHCQDVPIAHPGGVDPALSDFDPAALLVAEETLQEEFPTVPLEMILGILTDSQRAVLGVVRANDLDKSVDLARLRLELETRSPGRFS